MKQHAYWVSTLLIMSACQGQMPAVAPERPTTPALTVLASDKAKPDLQAQALISGNQIRIRLQLPPRPPFGIQALNLSEADTIQATVSDSHGKTYTPDGADGNGHVAYPSNGVIELTFNNVLPDPLLFVELKIQDNLIDINQAELAAVLKHTQTTNATTTINFQTTATAKTMRTLLSNNPVRARSLSLTALTSLLNTITGGLPTYAQRHPTLVNTTLLAQDLEAQNPGTLTAANYRLNGHVLNVNVSGLFHTDRIVAQVTDAASAIVTQGNGSHSMGRGTPGNNLQVRLQAAPSNINRYTLNTTPGPINLTEGGNTTLTVEALSQVGEFRVNTYTLYNQDFSNIGMDASGNFVICWTSNFQDGSSFGVYAQRYNNQGIPLGNEFRVNTVTTGGQSSSSIAMDSDGDFVVAWQSGHAGSSDIYAQRYNSIGEPQGGEFRVNTFTTNEQGRPFVAMDASGNFTLVWNSTNQETNLNIYGQRYDALGVPQGSEFRVNSPVGIPTLEASSISDNPIAMNASGAHVVAWRYLNDIYARTYTATGIAGTPFRVNTYTTGIQQRPQVAIDDAGNFIIGWTSDGQDGDNLGVYAQRYAADSSPLGGEFRVNVSTTGAQNFPFVAMNGPSGDFVFTWTSQPDTTYQVLARRFSADGTPQTGEYTIKTSNSGQEAPNLAIAPDGSGVFNWMNSGQDGDIFGIFAYRFDNNGALITAP